MQHLNRVYRLTFFAAIALVSRLCEVVLPKIQVKRYFTLPPSSHDGNDMIAKFASHKLFARKAHCIFFKVGPDHRNKLN